MEVIRVSPNYGEINVFSPYLIHGGGSNPGKKTRCSLEIRFQKKETKDEHENLISLFGLGTIWYSLPWPIFDKSWSEPSIEHILLNQLNPILCLSKKNIIIDTAPSYKDSEKKLSKSLKLINPNHKSKYLIGTKVGLYTNSKNEGVIDFSVERINKSLKRSYKLLGNLYIIYLHITSKMSFDEAMSIINNRLLYYEMISIKKVGRYGCQKLGITISSIKLLKEIINKNLLVMFDVLQVSSYLVRDCNKLLIKWKKRNKNNLVIVNSVIRHKPNDMNYEEAYTSIIKSSSVDVILCGSKKHISSKIKFFKKNKVKI